MNLKRNMLNQKVISNNNECFKICHKKACFDAIIINILHKKTSNIINMGVFLLQQYPYITKINLKNISILQLFD